jgi:glycosyltransferase involved in cell wall biosynthesis
MKIGILTPSLTRGDAVSNDVLGMYGALQEVGDVRIFSEGLALTDSRVSPVSKVRSFLKKADDLLIYHYAREWEPAMPLLNRVTCRKVIKYHNITPPNYFERYSPDFARMCFEGRAQLKPIATSACDLFLSDSDFNRHELLAGGAAEEKCFTVPPFHHIDRLNSTQPEVSVLDQLRNGHVNICTVGRVAPNKGHPELIAAFAIYHYDCNPNSRLIIVGKQETRLAKYTAVLRSLIRRLRLENAVTFTGEVSDARLSAYYRGSNIFVTTSQHEGFCVPLVEAMAMELPIVAYTSTAIPETVGSAGIVWEERNPFLIAESINFIASDASLSKNLSIQGCRRYQELYTTERIKKRFVDAIQRLL